jgi:hypothetical protein
MRVVTLIPWRGGDRYREKVWEFVQPKLEDLGFPVYTGDSEGEWARAAAVNNAAKAAGEWDVALVGDADTILERGPVERALTLVNRTRGAARPHDRRWMLSSIATRFVMHNGLERLGERHLSDSAPGGGALVIHRRAYEGVGGYDESYVGWGYEDTAMDIRLLTEHSWRIIPGNAYHLFHRPANLRDPKAVKNRARMESMRIAYSWKIAEHSEKAGFDLNTVL